MSLDVLNAVEPFAFKRFPLVIFFRLDPSWLFFQVCNLMYLPKRHKEITMPFSIVIGGKWSVMSGGFGCAQLMDG